MQTKLIIVDAGHGQSNRRPGLFDPGAVRYSRNGHGPDQIVATEADFALRYTIALDDALRARGFPTLLTHPDSSTSRSLRQRVTLAQENQAALLLSLHLNAAPRRPANSRSARGHEVLYRTRNGRTEARLAHLTTNMDNRSEQVSQAASRALDNFSVAALTLAGQTDTLGHQANLLLGASRGAVENLERLAGSPALVRSTENLERSTANLEKTTAATAEAAGHVRDMLSPRKKSFWRRLLGLLIPRPSIPIVK